MCPEHYAFLCRESEIAHSGSVVPFLNHSHIFSRKPHAVRFRDIESGVLITVATLL